MNADTRPCAIVTVPSGGIGLALARCCADAGYDLLLAADQAEIRNVASDLRAPSDQSMASKSISRRPTGGPVVRRDERPASRRVAGERRPRTRQGAFLDQNWSETRHVIDTKITGTVSSCTGSRAGCAHVVKVASC